MSPKMLRIGTQMEMACPLLGNGEFHTHGQRVLLCLDAVSEGCPVQAAVHTQ